MKHACRAATLAAVLICTLLGTTGPVHGTQKIPIAADFRIEDCDFSTRGRNPYFSIEPGDVLVLRGQGGGELIVVRITVLEEQRIVDFVTERGEDLRVRTRVVETRRWVNDELTEVSQSFYARCERTDDIFNFGRDVKLFAGGRLVSRHGSWLAGVRDAQPGIIMPGSFLLGSRYFQEVAPGIALHSAEHTAMGLTLAVPAGTFGDCVEVTESTPLEPDTTIAKLYCPGVGLAADHGIELSYFDLKHSD